MSVRHQIPEMDGTYFITITCFRWLSLFEITNGYDLVYTWFDYLKEKGHYINGYVIMPNHLHALVSFSNTGKSINTIIGNGKRFMAYDLVKRLQETSRMDILSLLRESVNPTDRSRGKLHEVFEPSFDWKECTSTRFIEQKLAYIHKNPCQGKWNLVGSAVDYVHSSAMFYDSGIHGIYEVRNYREMEDIDLTIRK